MQRKDIGAREKTSVGNAIDQWKSLAENTVAVVIYGAHDIRNASVEIPLKSEPKVVLDINYV